MRIMHLVDALIINPDPGPEFTFHPWLPLAVSGAASFPLYFLAASLYLVLLLLILLTVFFFFFSTSSLFLLCSALLQPSSLAPLAVCGVRPSSCPCALASCLAAADLRLKERRKINFPYANEKRLKLHKVFDHYTTLLMSVGLY